MILAKSSFASKVRMAGLNPQVITTLFDDLVKTQT